MLAEGASANTGSRYLMKLKKYCNRGFHFISPGTEEKDILRQSFLLVCFVLHQASYLNHIKLKEIMLTYITL